MAPYKYITGVEYEDVTLRLGSTEDVELYNWFTEALRNAAGIGGRTSGTRRDVVIRETSKDFSIRSRNPVALKILDQWVLRGAMPVAYSPGAWDSHSDEFLIEEVTLTYDYLELVPRSETPTVTRTDHVASRFP